MTRGTFISAALPLLATIMPARVASMQTLQIVPYAPPAPNFSGALPVYSTTGILHDVRPPVSVYVGNIDVVRMSVSSIV